MRMRHNENKSFTVNTLGQAGKSTLASATFIRAAKIAGGTSTSTFVLRPNMDVGFSYAGFTAQDAGSLSIRPQKPTTPSEWLRRNAGKINRYAGQWVAITKSGIVASSSDFDQVFQQAKERGAPNPLVFKVPKATRGLKIVSNRIL